MVDNESKTNSDCGEATSSADSSNKAFFPSYKNAEITEKTLMGSFQSFLTVIGYPEDVEVVIRPRDIADIAIRVLKREEYYRYFHDIEISEKKRSALLAYWVVKLRPFTIIDSRYLYNDDSILINEKFAAFLLIASACLNADQLGFSAERFNEMDFHSDYVQKLVYSFRYRNLGIDAFVLLAEGLTPEVFTVKFSSTI